MQTAEHKILNRDGLYLLMPDWPAPAHVKAVTTTRQGGVSKGPYDSLNLAMHVGDDPVAVKNNRSRVKEVLELPDEPAWLTQVHGSHIADAATCIDDEADGSYSYQQGVVCTVLTADCLPLLLCDRQGKRVAAAHAGWKGLAAGVIEAAVSSLQRDPGEIYAWLGPAIGPGMFEVGSEVRDIFIEIDITAESAFMPKTGDKWLADIYQLAWQRLAALGVSHVYGGNYCTYTQDDWFYSYRRDGVTGRMASMIWL
jgi:YfiH family protein